MAQPMPLPPPTPIPRLVPMTRAFCVIWELAPSPFPANNGDCCFWANGTNDQRELHAIYERKRSAGRWGQPLAGVGLGEAEEGRGREMQEPLYHLPGRSFSPTANARAGCCQTVDERQRRAAQILNWTVTWPQGCSSPKEGTSRGQGVFLT